MSNLFITTDMEQIQAMALICHCLRNNLDMNTAWILMGASLYICALATSTQPRHNANGFNRRHDAACPEYRFTCRATYTHDLDV